MTYLCELLAKQMARAAPVCTGLRQENYGAMKILFPLMLSVFAYQ